MASALLCVVSVMYPLLVLSQSQVERIYLGRNISSYFIVSDY
jgi:hypothetical protein